MRCWVLLLGVAVAVAVTVTVTVTITVTGQGRAAGARAGTVQRQVHYTQVQEGGICGCSGCEKRLFQVIEIAIIMRVLAGGQRLQYRVVLGALMVSEG